MAKQRNPEQPHVVVNDDYTVDVRGWHGVETFDLMTPVDFQTIHRAEWVPEPVNPFSTQPERRLTRTMKVSFEIRERPKPPPVRIYNTVINLPQLRLSTGAKRKIQRSPA